jgi:hypothetical protein
MLFREVIALHCENHKKRTRTVYVKCSASYVTAGAIYLRLEFKQLVVISNSNTVFI